MAFNIDQIPTAVPVDEMDDRLSSNSDDERIEGLDYAVKELSWIVDMRKFAKENKENLKQTKRVLLQKIKKIVEEDTFSNNDEHVIYVKMKKRDTIYRGETLYLKEILQSFLAKELPVFLGYALYDKIGQVTVEQITFCLGKDGLQYDIEVNLYPSCFSGSLVSSLKDTLAICYGVLICVGTLAMCCEAFQGCQ